MFYVYVFTILQPLNMTQYTLADNVDQDQTARSVQPDLGSTMSEIFQ